jgi:hypothetical protein
MSCGKVERAVPEFIYPVFAKTSPKRSLSLIINERFGLVFAKTGSINSGAGVQHLLSHFSSPSFGVKTFYNYGQSLVGIPHLAHLIILRKKKIFIVIFTISILICVLTKP